MKRMIIIASVTILSAVAGYAYYSFVGCRNGTCAITSSPYLSLVFSAAFGAMLGALLTERRKKDADL